MNKPVRARLVASLLAAAAVSLAAFLAPASSAADRVSAEDLTARHLASLGTAEALAAAKSRIILGRARFTFRSGGSGMAEGDAVLASDGPRSMLSMRFGAPDYPHDMLSFNGRDFKVRDIRPGVRSILGEIFLRNGELFREGIVGGALSSAWAMSNLSERRAQLEYAGTDRINGAEVHKLRYLPRRGSDFKITLFFDAATFRHVRTQYDRTVAAAMGTVDTSARQRETSIKIIEDFSDFRAESGLTLPHAYKITYSAYGQNNGVTQEWAFTLTRYTFNEPIDTRAFDLSAE